MINIGLMGYGNLSRAVIDNLQHFPDMRLTAVFSRRPQAVKIDYPVYAADRVDAFVGQIDVMLMCGGSATDLPVQSPRLARLFNIVDSFDTHANIPAHVAAVDEAARAGDKLAVVSVGWDPGLFSLMRAYFNAFLPDGTDYTFWGAGVSQGHSDAVRRIAGVKHAVQYTVPKQAALDAVRGGEAPQLSVRDKHSRICFVVAEAGADHAAIERAIVTMPHYFADYDTTVHFIDEETFAREHAAMPHGGTVLRTGHSTPDIKQLLELNIKLESNPHFTAGIMLAYARALSRLVSAGRRGCLTPFDVPPAALAATDDDTLRRTLL